MNDLGTNLRQMLDAKVREAGTPPMPQPTILRRARRRQVGTAIASGAAVAALVACVVVGVQALSSERGTSIADEPVVTSTVNGISIDAPESWYLADPESAGLQSGDVGLPRLVLVMASIPPGPEVSCPGIAEGPTSSFLMTVQEQPLALAGDASTPWPVALEPYLAATDSGCYPGWNFLAADWTASGRTFEGVAGFAPDASDEERAAVLAAFSSMRFEPSEHPPQAMVIASGEVSGEPWSLTLTREGSGWGLGFGWERLGGGEGGISAPRENGFGGGIGGSSSPTYPGGDETRPPLPMDRTGVVTAEAERVEYQLVDGSTIDAQLYDLPQGTFEEPAKAFLLLVPGDTLVDAGYLVAYGAAGTQVGREYVDFSPVWLSPKIIEEATREQLDVLHDLQIAGGVARRYYQEHGSSFEGLDPEGANAISDATTYNTSAVAVPGEVSLRVVGARAMVLASATPDGQVYSVCFGSGPEGGVYGRNDTSDPTACSNEGWP
jgi:hypothetical protein